MQQHWKAERDAGRLGCWKGCRKIGKLEGIQEDWKAGRDATTLKDKKGCRNIGRLERYRKQGSATSGSVAALACKKILDFARRSSQSMKKIK